MSAMASQITSLTIVYLTVYSKRRSKKTSKPRVTGLCEGNSPVTGEFPAQSASNAENVSIWWRHHVRDICDMALHDCQKTSELTMKDGGCTRKLWDVQQGNFKDNLRTQSINQNSFQLNIKVLRYQFKYYASIAYHGSIVSLINRLNEYAYIYPGNSK